MATPVKLPVDALALPDGALLAALPNGTSETIPVRVELERDDGGASEFALGWVRVVENEFMREPILERIILRILDGTPAPFASARTLTISSVY